MSNKRQIHGVRRKDFGTIMLLRVIKLLPKEEGEYLSEGIAKWKNGMQLDRALGISPKGFNIAMRNKHLNNAGSIMSYDAHKMERAVSLFTSRKWPNWKHREEVPSEATKIESELFKALKIGDIPRSSRQYERIFMDMRHD